MPQDKFPGQIHPPEQFPVCQLSVTVLGLLVFQQIHENSHVTFSVTLMTYLQSRTCIDGGKN